MNYQTEHLERMAERDPMVEALAAAYHRDYCDVNFAYDSAGNFMPSGRYVPRVKYPVQAREAGQTEWVNPDRLEGRVQVGEPVDIANTAGEELPDFFKEGNRVAAADMIELFKALPGISRVNIRKNPTVYRLVGTWVHENYLVRNPWERGGPLGKPFDGLIEEEQNKDIRQFELAQQMLFPEAGRKVGRVRTYLAELIMGRSVA